MLGDRVRVRYLVGSKVEEEIIQVQTNGGTVRISHALVAGEPMLVVEEGRTGNVLRSAAFNPAFMIVAIEEKRRR